MGKFFKVITIVTSALIAFVVGLAIAGYFLEDKLIRYTISQLNQRLTATLNVKEVNASLIRGFPFAAVTFKEVEIIEGSLQTPEEFETGLLSLDEVVVKINLIGLLSNRYNIERLVLKNGWINLYFDNTGKGNFEIFKTSSDSSSNWILDVDKLQFSNVNLSYIDPRTAWVCKGYVEHGELKGKIKGSVVDLNVRVSGAIGSLRQGAFQYIRNERLEISTTFAMDDNAFRFNDAVARLGKAKLNINGSVGRTVGAPVSLSVSGDNLSTNSLLMLLSQFNLSLPPKTKTKGHFAFNININGVSKMEEPFKINLGFSTKEILLAFQGKPEFRLSDVEGTFTNGSLGKPESSAVNISSFRIDGLSSYIYGNLHIKNINTPLYHLNVKHSLDISELKLWDLAMPITGGKVQGSLEALGLLDGLDKITLTSFENSKFVAQTTFSHLDFEKVGRIPDLKSLSGQFLINNQDITKAKVQGLLNGSNFEADFSVGNAGSIVFNNGKAEVNTSIVIDSVNSAWLLVSPIDSAPKDGVSAWSRIRSISGDVFIDNFVHQKFIAKPLSATFYLKEDELVCNSFLCRTCDGVITGRMGATQQENNRYTLRADVDLDGLNISNLFDSFDNFNQSTITNQNISGDIKGNILFSANIDNGGIDLKSVVATSALTLTDGRLKDVKQLESLSRFIELEELKNIYFSTLRNTVSVANETVVIPQMEVSSSALNMLVSGEHKFDGAYKYSTQIKLFDVLFKKALAKNTEFGSIEHDADGARLFLKIEGDNTDNHVSYDKSQARAAFKTDLQEEKKNLKSILQDEFKFLKRKPDSIANGAQDSLPVKNAAKKVEENKKNDFSIEWDDE